MARPQKLDSAAIDTWLAAHEGWSRSSGDGSSADGSSGDEALVKAFTFPDFASALAFTVRLGMAAEKRDHHPDIHLGWGKVRVVWTTHDAGGITSLDLALAETSDAFGA